MSETDTAKAAHALHGDAIVIDATCPLGEEEQYIDWWKTGGTTVMEGSLATENAEVAARSIGLWLERIARRDDLVQVTKASQIEECKRTGKLGIIFHFQGTGPFEDDVKLVWTFQALGVRMVQLAYNVKNRVGDGATERTDAGLSIFGVRLVKELNRCRVAVDCTHTGERTSLDAIEASQRPVILSHSNCRAVHDTRRNVSDELIKAIAASGGVIGMNGFPAFVSARPHPTLDEFIAHIDHVAELVGIDHVGLGIDYFLGQVPVCPDDLARRQYDGYIENGMWREEEYPPPPYRYPQGIDTPQGFPNLTARLLERGYLHDDVRKILGLNWVRVFREIWGE